MSELIKTDVGEFFVEHTKNFVKEPPDSMWESIESHIPQYSVSTANNSLLKYLVSGIGLSVIIIAAILYYFQTGQNYTENSNVKQNNTQVNINSSNTLQTVENKINKADVATTLNTKQISINSTSKTKQSENKTVENNTQNKTNSNNVAEPNKSIKYSINATTYKNLNEIIFENTKKENVIDLKNPLPNAFGFYEIDISKLSSGTYNIWVVSNGNKTLHKTETFK